MNSATALGPAAARPLGEPPTASPSHQQPSQPDAVTALIAGAQRLVDLTLRYVAAGGTAVLVFGLIQGRNFEFLTVSKQQEFSVWLLIFFVATIGLVIYTVHRALLYRVVTLVLYPVVGFFQKPINLSPWSIEDQLRDRSYARTTPLARTFAAWAAQCHFLYCSAWGVLGAVAVAWHLGHGVKETYALSFSVAAVLFSAAVIHDWKLVRQELRR